MLKIIQNLTFSAVNCSLTTGILSCDDKLVSIHSNLNRVRVKELG